jgi:hypothetical protein
MTPSGDQVTRQYPDVVCPGFGRDLAPGYWLNLRQSR